VSHNALLLFIHNLEAARVTSDLALDSKTADYGQGGGDARKDLGKQSKSFVL
jgi:hypothetical protein